MSEITWGMPVVLDLFFAGLAAGAFCFAVLASRRHGEGFLACSRAAAFLAPLSVAFGLSMLILDLRFKTRFWFTMTVFNGDSPMSLGVWLLTLFSVIAALYAMFWMPSVVRERLPVIGRWPLWSQQRVRDALGSAGSLVALLVSIYTGVLLSATSIPIWRNPALPALFCFSSMATGFAAGLLLALLFAPGKRREIIAGPFRWLQGSYRVLLPAYLLAIIVYVLLFFLPGMRPEDVLPLITGWNGLVWWLGVVGVGIVLPIFLVLGKAKASLSRVIVVHGALLAGGFLLRLVLVFTGQEHIVATAYRLTSMP
ncbi:MAG: NrfD/PsrC family molybdoenzyme membrane anchor subunit [Deltaproteobacteria bacterium]